MPMQGGLVDGEKRSETVFETALCVGRVYRNILKQKQLLQQRTILDTKCFPSRVYGKFFYINIKNREKHTRKNFTAADFFTGSFEVRESTKAGNDELYVFVQSDKVQGTSCKRMLHPKKWIPAFAGMTLL